MPNPEGVVANTPTLLCKTITSSSTGTTEVVPTTERVVVTAAFFKSTIALDNMDIQNQAGTSLYVIALAGADQVALSFPHPILSTDGIQVVVTGTTVRWNLAYKVI